MVIGLSETVNVNSLLDSWSLWEERIISYSVLEMTHRPRLKELLPKLNEPSKYDRGELVFITGRVILASTYAIRKQILGGGGPKQTLV